MKISFKDKVNKVLNIYEHNSTRYDIIESKNIIEIQIIGDGNCFFLCVSQNLEKTQENHRYYLDLIYNYIIDNRNQFQRFYPKKENETNENYEIRDIIHLFLLFIIMVILLGISKLPQRQ